MAKLEDPDLVLNIIVRLPVKSVLQCRCVSKAWCKLLKDPYFVKMHLRHAIEMNRFSVMIHPFFSFRRETYTLAYDPSSSTLSNPVGMYHPSGTTFCGTCNGLVCLTTTTSENNLVLWNPATKEFKDLPTVPAVQSETRLSYVKHGFGYDDKIDDYKIVSLLGIRDEYRCQVHIYTLKSNSWRRLETIPYDLYHPGPLDIAQASVNGAVHWLAETNSEPHKVIISFDFKYDRFDKMPLPSFLGEYGYGDTNLCSLGGSLCLHASLVWSAGVDVWEMKEYGVTESWAKLFTINHTTICQVFRQLVPLQFVKNGEILLGYDSGEVFHLDLYDLKRGTFINLKARDANRNRYSDTTFVYVESLVPLNSGRYVGLPEIEDSEANARKTDLDSLNSGTHVGGLDRGNSGYDDDSEEEVDLLLKLGRR